MSYRRADKVFEESQKLGMILSKLDLLEQRINVFERKTYEKINDLSIKLHEFKYAQDFKFIIDNMTLDFNHSLEDAAATLTNTYNIINDSLNNADYIRLIADKLTDSFLNRIDEKLNNATKNEKIKLRMN